MFGCKLRIYRILCFGFFIYDQNIYDWGKQQYTLSNLYTLILYSFLCYNQVKMKQEDLTLYRHSIQYQEILRFFRPSLTSNSTLTRFRSLNRCRDTRRNTSMCMSRIIHISATVLNLNSFNDETCWLYFRFRYNELEKVYELF